MNTMSKRADCCILALIFCACFASRMIGTNAFFTHQSFVSTRNNAKLKKDETKSRLYAPLSVDELSSNEDTLNKESLKTPSRYTDGIARRSVLQSMTFLMTTTQSAKLVLAADVDADSILRRLRKVPVFAVVSAQGVPFFIVSKERTVPCGYFYTSYEAAESVLKNALESTAVEAAKNPNIPNDWDQARVTAVPLDFAMKLQNSRPKNKAQNNQRLDTVFDFLPSIADLDAAQLIDTSGFYGDRGRVPLFYFDEFELPPTSEGQKSRTPVFFKKADLLKAWEKNNAGVAPPTVRVIELVETFNAMLKDTKNPLFESIVFIPSSDSLKAAKECEQARGSKTAYALGEMILVQGS